MTDGADEADHERQNQDHKDQSHQPDSSISRAVRGELRHRRRRGRGFGFSSGSRCLSHGPSHSAPRNKGARAYFAILPSRDPFGADLPHTPGLGATMPDRLIIPGMIENVAEDARRSQESEGNPDPPMFESEGRPPHDFFPDGQVIRLRLSPDYTPSEWVPLWPSSDCTDALVPSQLLHELIAWQEEFLQNFHPDKGWRSKQAMDHWAAEQHNSKRNCGLHRRVRLSWTWTCGRFHGANRPGRPGTASDPDSPAPVHCRFRDAVARP